ncbi:hypothetical protein CVT26_009221 [Gymnopilus dilepis]|uniref:Uncharacterized protein n=1 Tax=Gymnopilus dilepis TaxID=231916 RepID=A0A409WCH7_9AGAR|nr:hypothetical protein CVT26_009221 [Gymnopilus dilepis]
MTVVDEDLQTSSPPRQDRVTPRHSASFSLCPLPPSAYDDECSSNRFNASALPSDVCKLFPSALSPHRIFLFPDDSIKVI